MARKTAARPANAYKPTTRPALTVYIAPDLLERARDAVDFLSGPPERLTFTLLLELALKREIGRLAKKHHGGEPFPKRAQQLRRGSRPA